MSDNNQKPKPWDAVLGGHNQPKPHDAVLGGKSLSSIGKKNQIKLDINISDKTKNADGFSISPISKNEVKQVKTQEGLTDRLCKEFYGLFLFTMLAPPWDGVFFPTPPLLTNSIIYLIAAIFVSIFPLPIPEENKEKSILFSNSIQLSAISVFCVGIVFVVCILIRTGLFFLIKSLIGGIN